jgi:hypothetical protein
MGFRMQKGAPKRPSGFRPHPPDRLLANGVAMAAARRKAGGLQWGDFPWESGAKTHRNSFSLRPVVFRPKKYGVILARPNKPPGVAAFRRSPGMPPPKKVLAAPSRRALLARRRQHTAGSTSCACRWLCAQMANTTTTP